MMRAALWFVGLFALAVAVALFAGSNQAVVSLFWSPYRVDLSLNLVLLLLVVLVVLVHVALRALSALLLLPHQAKRWRQQQKERTLYQSLVESFSHLQAGRYVRARKSALALLKLSDELQHERVELPQLASLRALAHMLAADSAHALRDTTARDLHYAQALEDVPVHGTLPQQEVREGAQMRAARWALDDHEPQEALQRLDQLPPGAKRRTMALRIQLKASRMAQDPQTALETARLLANHGGLSPQAAQSMMRGLVLEQLRHTHDAQQVQQLWNNLPTQQQQQPDVALTATQQLLHVGGDSALARQWLLPIWEQATQGLPQASALRDDQILRLLQVLHTALTDLDAAWLARIEHVQRANPQDPRWQYLAGMACVERQLWGKGEALLQGAVARLREPTLRASAWKALALLAEHKGDAAAAAHAWRQAAQQS